MKTKVAKIYARALFDAAREADALDVIRDELDAVVQIGSDSKELKKFLDLPQVPAGTKKKVIDQIFDQFAQSLTADQRKHVGLVQNFVKLLIDKGRQGLLPQIFGEFNKLVDDYKGILETDVTTAIPLDSDLEDALKKKLEKLTNRKITLRKRVDPEILGGVVLRIRDMQIDGSVANGMRQLKETLLARTSTN